MALKIGEEQAVQMPMKTVISLIVIVALGTMGYFQIVERLNIADTKIKIMEKDLEENTEFRIKPNKNLKNLRKNKMKKIIQKIKDLWNKAAEWIVAQYNKFLPK